MRALVVGPGLDEHNDVGPLVNAEAVAKVHELVEDAVAAGAQVTTGGSALERPGYYYQPTVLTDVPAGAALLREEIFGPVAPVVTFSGEDEAVELANTTEYGLVAYIYTSDLARGMRVSERVEAGMIGLNRGLVSDPAAPFGGVKQSGIGREGGHEGVLDYTESKYIATQW
jgi:succinate-semialdehyde dehydrogenase/glutarate-semialdehyde dehydrogenase